MASPAPTRAFAEPGWLAGRRVLVVLPSLEMGGAERQALLLARHLQTEEGAELEIWGLAKGEAVPARCEEVGIACRLVRTPWPRSGRGRLRVLARFAFELRRARPAVVLPYTMRPNVFCGLAWRLTGARLCVWNQRDEGRGEGVGRLWQRLAATATPRFVSNSRHGRDHLISTLGVEPGKIEHVTNGVLLEPARATRAEWRRRLGLDEETRVALMVANLHRNKDHATLLEAWRYVVEKYPSGTNRPVLLLAGRRGDTAELLEARALELGLGDHLRLLGSVNDISGLYRAADLAVFSSRLEGCPNGVLEAMASGLAVVGTDIPGICEALGEAGRPYLAAPGDAEALAERIVALLNDAEARHRLGAHYETRIAENFDPGASCRAMTELLERSII